MAFESVRAATLHSLREPASFGAGGAEAERKKSGDLHADVIRESLQSEREEKQRSKTTGHWLLDSVPFQTAVAMLIAMNTILMGAEADYPEYAHVWTVTETVFTMIFLLEVILKFGCLGRQYFRDNSNLVDFTLVVLSLTDLVLLILGTSVDLQSLTIFRVMRIFRLARIFRLLKQFERLAIIMWGVLDAIRSALWVTLILLVVIYACAIFCTDYIGRGDPSLYPGYSLEESNADDNMEAFNPHARFGSMYRSMFSLFNIVIMSEWVEVTRPLMAKQPHLILFFVLFVVLTTFGLMNVVVGMIVDSVMTHIRDVIAQNEEIELSRKLATLHELQGFVQTIDRNHDDRITLPEVEMAWKEPGLRSLLKDVGLPRDMNPRELLAMLDADGDGALVGDEFVRGLYRLIDGSSFQHACINQIAMNSVKRMVRHQMDLAIESQALVRRFNENLEELRAEVRASLGSLRGTAAEEERTFKMGMSSQVKMEPEKECANVAYQPGCVKHQATSQPHQPCATAAEVSPTERAGAGVPVLEPIASPGPQFKISLQEESIAQPGPHYKISLQEEDTSEEAQQGRSPTPMAAQTWSVEAQEPHCLAGIHGQQLLIEPRGLRGGFGAAAATAAAAAAPLSAGA